MLNIHRASSFKRDTKKIASQRKKMADLDAVIEMLAQGKRLDARYKDHALTGDLHGFRECHIKPDWLLIYCIADNTLYLARTGSHSDLF